MRLLPKALIVMSLLLAAVTCAKAVIFKMKTTSIPNDIKKAVDAGIISDEKIKEFQGIFTAAAVKLKKKSIFAPPPPGKVNPVKKVDAIMGDEALINNKWYKAGDSIGEAKLITVESAQVTIEWNGKKKTLSPIAAPTTYAVQKKAEPVKGPIAAHGKPVAVVAKNQTEVEAAPIAEEDPLAWMGVKISPRLRAKFLEMWNSATPEERAKGKKEWEKMPDHKKQETIDMMEMNIDQM